MGYECSDVTLTNGTAMLAETRTSPLISISSSHNNPPNPQSAGYTPTDTYTLATNTPPPLGPLAMAEPCNKVH